MPLALFPRGFMWLDLGGSARSQTRAAGCAAAVKATTLLSSVENNGIWRLPKKGQQLVTSRAKSCMSNSGGWTKVAVVLCPSPARSSTDRTGRNAQQGGPSAAMMPQHPSVAGPRGRITPCPRHRPPCPRGAPRPLRHPPCSPAAPPPRPPAPWPWRSLPRPGTGSTPRRRASRQSWRS